MSKIFNNIAYCFTFLLGNWIFFKFFLAGLSIYQNDYLNPFTMTFKNPKTIQMFNIIILYHYVMAFLVGIVVFTFLFIFFSFFRSYFLFYIKPKVAPKYYTFDDIFEYEDNHFIITKELFRFYKNKLFQKKIENMKFYKEDMKASLKDHITHAPLLEFLWVVFPSLILVAIAYPSIIMLYYNEAYVDPVFNITVIGNQWYWTYEYNDFNLAEIFKKHITNEKSVLIRTLEDVAINITDFKCFVLESDNPLRKLRDSDKEIIHQIPRRISVDSNMIIANDPKFLRLLTTDQCLVIPSKTPIRLLITSNDVIHSWAIPSYGIKLDAVPGRVNQQILNVPLLGTSWGQCSELCGVNHAYMPIEVKVIHFTDFLFFMELRIKEILLPHFVNYYQERVDIIKNFSKALGNKVSRDGLTEQVNATTIHGILRFEKFNKVTNAFPQFFNKK